MSGSNRGMGQPKGTTKADIMLEAMARSLLSAVLPKSISQKVEYGAVICKNDRTGELSATKLHRSTDSDNKVDVGLSEPNCGCPDGTTPVAYYHTHPFDKIGAGNGTYLHASQDFSDPDDKRIANDVQLVAFLGSHDGKFRRYVPPKRPTVMVDGRPVQLATDADGNALPETFNDTTVLNGTLPTR